MHRLFAVPLSCLLLLAAAPAPLQYAIDSAASDVSAKVAFFGLASKTARFPRMSGGATMAAGDPATLSLDVTLDARALTAPDAVTLRRLKSEKFFWVERYPAVRFAGRGLAMRDATSGTISGRLTARGVTRPVTLAVTFAAPPTEAPPDAPLDLTATTTIDRRDFGMTAYPLIVGRKVDIRIAARMVRR